MPTALMSVEKIRHVNNHLTPMALLIVVPGLVLAPLPKLVVVSCAILMVYSVCINYVSIYALKWNIHLIGTIRVSSNYIVNILLLWILYPTWPLAWILLLMMSIGVALYQSRRDSLLSSVAMALMLLAVHWNFGNHSLQDWVEVGAKASIILLFSLFVNGSLKMGRRLND